MKKKLLALMMALSMAFPMAVSAAETEAVTEVAAEAATGTLVMQGVDDLGIVWTLAINTENAMACVSLTQDDTEEPTYITGPIAFGEDTFTISDQEDGNDYEFGYQDISENESIITYEPTGSEVTLTAVDQSVLEDDSNYSIYAGYAEDGTQYTFGFDFDNNALAMNQLTTDGKSDTIAGSFEADEDGQTLHFTSEDGVESDIVVTDVEGTENQIDITVGDETVRLSLVDMNVLE